MRQTTIALVAVALIGGLGFATLTTRAAPLAANSGSGPVVLELFTSQGCSSCPPADLLAAKLAREPGLLVLTRPVTYWNQLGWKDTLARPENTELQRAYAGRIGDGGNVYTPQLVVGGRKGTIGSDEPTIRALTSRMGAASAVIAIERRADGTAAIGLGGTTSAPAELLLVALDSAEQVPIARGENGGRTITYTNVVRAEHQLASWSGGKQGVVVAAKDLRVAGADRYAVILREPDGGPILAAATIR